MARHRLRGGANPTSIRRRRSSTSRRASTRLRFESLLLRLSAGFANASADDVDRQIAIWLPRLAAFIGVERTSFWELPHRSRRMSCIHFYSAPGCEPPDEEMFRHPYKWLREQYRLGKVIAWSRIPDQIPAHAAAERAYAARSGAKSALAIPLATGSSTWIIAFASVGRHHEWSQVMIRRLKIVGEILAAAVQRQRAEVSLRSSEERFRGAFENFGVGMAIVSVDGRTKETNSAMTRILGYSAAELHATSFPALTHPDDLAISLEYSRRALEGEIDHYELEKRYIHKNGQEVPALLTSTLVRDAGERPLYFVSLVQDFTERVRAQGEIERLRSRLAHSGRLWLLGRLTASLAHELLQPITAALGNAEAAHALAAQHADAGRLYEYLGNVIEDIGRAGQLIDRVRGLLRQEKVLHRMLDVNQLVEEVTKVARGDLMSRGVRLTLQLDARRPQVDGDPVGLQQIMLNLLLNGAEASQDASPARRVVVVSTTSHGPEVRLAVRDHGAGIDPEHLRRMFEPFFSTKPGGMGLGLAISADIARAHGGKLWAEQNRTGGMTFFLALPARSDAIEAPPKLERASDHSAIP